MRYSVSLPVRSESSFLARRRGPARSSQRGLRLGFTLIEIVIVGAVMAALAGLMFPTIQKQIVRVRTMTSAKQVASVFQRARLEAVRRNVEGEVEIVGRRVVATVDTVTFFGLLSAGVEFGAPPGETVVDGFAPDDKAVFTVAGGVRDSGAFRIEGPTHNNWVEVRIEPAATGRVEVRKWDGAAFKAQGEGGNSWTW